MLAKDHCTAKEGPVLAKKIFVVTLKKLPVLAKKIIVVTLKEVPCWPRR